jgi:hypothetical protein
MIFYGPYDITNWMVTITDGGDGSVDWSGAPASVKLVGADNEAEGSLTLFTIPAPFDDVIQFYWSYQTFDEGPSYDRAGYVIDGVYTQLTDNDGPLSQSGYASFSVLTGQVFGFYVDATDACCGRGEFSVQDAASVIPEPSTVALVGAGLLGLVLRRRR